MAHGQSEALVPMVQRVADEAEVSLLEIDLVAVTTGPGAFTGLRIGLATARGFALAADVPCYGVTTTEALAAAQESTPDRLVVALDTRRADVYVQSFTQGVADGLPAAVAYADLRIFLGDTPGPITVVGDAAEKVVDTLTGHGVEVFLADGPALPDAAVVAAVAAARWQPSETEVPPARPLYLRPPEAKVPAHGGRLRP